MKLMFMGARDDEMAAIEEWKAQNPGHDVTVTTDVLSLETVDSIEGHDALVVQQVIVPEPEVYARLQELGITQISSRTAGVDMFDLGLAREHGIAVTNVPVYSPNAIAEFALASTLHLTRRFPQIERKNAERDFRFAGLIGREIATLKVAIIGTGAIGFQTAKHFRALGAEVVAFDLFPRDDFAQVGTYAATIEEAVQGADVVSLHIPATAENHHLFDAEMLARMAPGPSWSTPDAAHWSIPAPCWTPSTPVPWQVRHWTPTRTSRSISATTGARRTWATHCSKSC